MEHSTEQFVRLAANGDHAAFTRLIRRYERSALSVALALAGNGESAGEITQEAFLRAWTHLARLKEPDRFGPWLMEIVRNLAIDQNRRRPQTAAEHDCDTPDPKCDSPLESLDRRESLDRLRIALSKLEPLLRAIVNLRYFDNLSSVEIGRILNLSPAAIDMRLTRARQRLKQMLMPKNEPERANYERLNF